MNPVEPDASILDTRVHGVKGHARLKLRDIYNLLASGKSDEEIRAEFPDIKQRPIELARAFLIAAEPELYKKLKNENAVSEYGILVDENLPVETVNSLHPFFSRLTHTRFVGLNGKKDPDVWRWAVNNNVEAIITRDKRTTRKGEDLTRIAVDEVVEIIKAARERGSDIDISALPLVIHINARHRPHDVAAELFKKYAAEILECIENRTTPYILVTADGVRKGPDYETLLEKYGSRKKDMDTVSRVPREVRLVEKCARKLASQRRQKNGSVSPEEIQEIKVNVREKIMGTGHAPPEP